MLLEYKYQIELKLYDGSTLTEIPIEQISGMLIDRNYDDNIMPIVIMQVAAGKQLLDKIITEKVNNTMFLRVKKFAVKDNTFVEDYINDEFVYYIMDDINYTANTEYTEETRAKDDILKSCKIGMINLRVSNKNKLILNNVYRNTSNQCMALLTTQDVGELVFEPMLSYVYEELLLPPIDNIKGILEYLNSRHTFYDTYYRYFMDFDRTYLLSSSGLGVETRDEPNNTVYIDIYDPAGKPAYIEGMSLDEKKRAYAIPVDANYSRMYTNNAAEKHFNILHGISSSGETKDVEVGINKSAVSVDRKKLVRVPYENFGILDNIKHNIEAESHILTISKSNIDSSIITLNKHYIVNNVQQYADLNGDFILARKVETYQRQGEYFVSENLITFRSSKQLE